MSANVNDTRKPGAASRRSDPKPRMAPRRARPRSVGFIVLNTLALWVSITIATTALWPIYQAAALVVLVAVSLVAGSTVAVLGALLRWPSWAVLVATAAAFLIIGVPVAVPAQAQFGLLPTLGGLRDLVTGVALGWKQLLTISLPVGEYQALLVPALVLVLGATVVGLTIALRARRGDFAVLAPIVVYVVATAFGPAYPSRAFVTPLALIAVIVFWLIALRATRRSAAIRLLTSQTSGPDAVRTESGQPIPPRREGTFASVRAFLGAAIILAIAAGSAVGAATLLPPGVDRTVLRSTIVQPFDPRDYVSPLVGFRSYLQPALANSVLFTITGLPTGGRVRIATLDTYDGVVFAVGSSDVTSESGSFSRVPSTVDQSATAGAAVSLDVTIAGYSGVWLPTVGKLEQISFDGPRAGTLRDAFYYNNVSGTAAVIGGLQPGDRYTLRAIVPTKPSAADMAKLEPGSARVPRPTNVPDAVAAKLDHYVANVQGAGARLVAMLAGLAADGYVSHGINPSDAPSRSGHAADRITELLTAPRMIGDAEQYAVAAALMAGDLGFPARVVFGFTPTASQVSGSDVSAWIEVNTVQFGWITIDPTPPLRAIPAAAPVDNAQVARPQTIVKPPLTSSEFVNPQTTLDAQQALPPSLDPVLQLVLGVLRVTAWVLVVLAILLAPFVVVIAAKLRRRQLRRKAANVIDQISGGWREFEDAVIDHGLAPAASSTRSEVAAIAGGARSQLLATVADRAIFSPAAPKPADADSVWRAVDELKAVLNEGLTRWQRLRARISLRSLGGYSVRTLLTKNRKVGL